MLYWCVISPAGFRDGEELNGHPLLRNDNLSRVRRNLKPEANKMQAETLNCPTCGAAVSKDATHCSFCEARLATVACPRCFAMMFAGAKFCPVCGAEAKQAEAVEAASRRCPRCRRCPRRRSRSPCRPIHRRRRNRSRRRSPLLTTHPPRAPASWSGGSIRCRPRPRTGRAPTVPALRFASSHAHPFDAR